MAKNLATLFKVPEKRVATGEVRQAEQDGAEQPATAPESKSEGKDKPQPESKAAPR
jgi:hypothetical protein